MIESHLENVGSAPITVDRLASAQLPLPPSAREIISRRGHHGGEFAECREAMPAQGWERTTRQGMTGHGGPPGLEVVCGTADRHTGLVLSAQLGWSGDTRLAIEQTDEGFAVLQTEARFAPGAKRLEPGESFTAPRLYLAISSDGRNGAMARQHAMVRDIAKWPGGSMKPLESEVPPESDVPPDAEGVPPEVEVVPPEVESLWDVLEQLPEHQRIAVVLRYYCGYRAAEIAKITDQPAATVRSHLRRAMKAMRKELTP